MDSQPILEKKHLKRNHSKDIIVRGTKFDFQSTSEKQFDRLRGLFKRHIGYLEHHIYNDIGDKSRYHIRLKFRDSYILINGNSTINKWFLPKKVIFVGYKPLNPGTMTYTFNNSIIFDYFRY